MSKSPVIPPAPADPSPLLDRLGYRFRDPSLLQTALTHRSFACESRPRLPDNQRLEFLGDAVLDLVAAEVLFLECPDWREGRLTKVRSRLTNTETLAAVAARIGLGDFLSLGRGEDASGGRAKPAVLADALEALVAAVWLDGGFPPVRDFFRSLFAPELREALASGEDLNPKGRLQELAQARWKCPPAYRLLSVSGPPHAPSFSVAVSIGPRDLATASGPSLRSAESAAASLALSLLSPPLPSHSDP